MANNRDKDRRSISVDDGASFPSLAPDLDTGAYLPSLADFDLTEDQKDEFLRLLWDIMCRFVEIGIEADVTALLTEEDKNAFSQPETNVSSSYTQQIMNLTSADAGKGASDDDT